jgi:hypothetical protein
MLEDLEEMLAEAISFQSHEGDCARLTRIQRVVDRYMRALLDSGEVSQDELVRIVACQRTAIHGPATRAVELDELEIIAA